MFLIITVLTSLVPFHVFLSSNHHFTIYLSLACMVRTSSDLLAIWHHLYTKLASGRKWHGNTENDIFSLFPELINYKISLANLNFFRCPRQLIKNVETWRGWFIPLAKVCIPYFLKFFVCIKLLLYCNIKTLIFFRELDDPHTFADLLVSTSNPYAFSC
jgi:hypothetical protein